MNKYFKIIALIVFIPSISCAGFTHKIIAMHKTCKWKREVIYSQNYFTGPGSLKNTECYNREGIRNVKKKYDQAIVIAGKRAMRKDDIMKQNISLADEACYPKKASYIHVIYKYGQRRKYDEVLSGWYEMIAECDVYGIRRYIVVKRFDEEGRKLAEQ